MNAVNIGEARSRLSQLVDRAAAGEDVIVARRGTPMVRITRLAPAAHKVRFGVLKGRVKVAADFDAPLPADVVAEFLAR
jgi:prevent-host-death family protein